MTDEGETRPVAKFLILAMFLTIIGGAFTMGYIAASIIEAIIP
jgi:hypothetical protein